jgi:hypothetical protein
VGQAYNPYTGTYAASHQGSNAYSSWGQSVVSNGNRSAYTQHYSNANGTVATAQGSGGGSMAAASTKYGNTTAGKTANGNMFATHDGNVYKNTGSGWSSYNNGNWNSVNSSANSRNAQTQNFQNSSANQAAAQQRSQSSQQSRQSMENRSSGSSEVDRSAQSRSRGEFQSQRFEGASRGGGGGRSFSGGGRRR